MHLRKKYWREKAKGKPRTDLFYQKNQTKIENLNLIQMRGEMKRPGKDITTEEILEIPRLVNVGDHKISIIIYRKKKMVSNAPALLFIHGGSFFGGDVETKRNQCRYLAEQSDAVVISPEYRLAPEALFPSQIQDIMAVLDYITDHAEEKDVEVLFYEGLDHGFFDRLGDLPQTADCIEGMAGYIRHFL